MFADVLSRRTGQSERGHHQLLQQKHQGHQSLRSKPRALLPKPLKYKKQTKLKSVCVCFSRTSDQRGALLQRQIRQVCGQRGDDVSLLNHSKSGLNQCKPSYNHLYCLKTRQSPRINIKPVKV